MIHDSHVFVCSSLSHAFRTSAEKVNEVEPISIQTDPLQPPRGAAVAGFGLLACSQTKVQAKEAEAYWEGKVDWDGASPYPYPGS